MKLCVDHVLPIFTKRLARALKLSRLSQHGHGHMSLECQLFGTMSGLCLDHHVWLCFTFKLDAALKFLRQSQYCPKIMSMDCLLFGNMSRPYLDPAWTMFGLALLTDQLKC